MVEKYDIVTVKYDDIARSGLIKGNEYYVGFVCSTCKIAGIINNDVLFYVPFRHILVVGKTHVEEKMRWIDEVESIHQVWKCRHD